MKIATITNGLSFTRDASVSAEAVKAGREFAGLEVWSVTVWIKDVSWKTKVFGDESKVKSSVSTLLLDCDSCHA